jgi:hypothetical protein
MHESFLHYLWQFQYFEKTKLSTTEGEKIEVFKPGTLNTNAGPDFSNAKLKIDGIEWAGSVEIHTQSSAWLEHKHDADPVYENVVLHVVWQYDKPIYRGDKTLLPTLVLKDRVDESLIREYKKLVNNPSSIPCKRSFPRVDALIKLSMLDKALAQRLEMKAVQVIEMLKQNHGDWQETAFQMVARNFGFKVNNEPFLQLAKALSYKTLLKHADKPAQIEALLFGQAGFLDIPVGDGHYQLLQREYRILGQKYDLLKKKLAKAQWRFMRLRPANFPTVRLAQFGALVAQQKNVFSRILEAEGYAPLLELFSVTQPEYWQDHYQFNRASAQTVAGLGESSIENIIINSVVPLLTAYGKYTDAPPIMDRALQILQQVPAERNAITKAWEQLDFPATNAFDSQALIELYNNFCQRRNCLNCTIGASLLKPS